MRDQRELLSKGTKVVDNRGLEYFLNGKIIGRGGSGIVYEAVRSGERGSYAIKELFPITMRRSQLQFGSLKENRKKELDAPQLLRQKMFQIISPLSLADEIVQPDGKKAETCMLVYENFSNQGMLLRDYVEGRKGKKLSVAESLCIAERIARAVGGLHQAGYLHGDIQPSNILLYNIYDCNQGIQNVSVGLLDFGCIRRLEHHENQAVRSTDPIDIVYETEGFSPLENRIGNCLTEAADVFQIGMVYQYMLTGIIYGNSGENGLNTYHYYCLYQEKCIEKQLENIVEYAVENNSFIYKKLKCLLLKSCSLYMDGRYGNAEEMADAFNEMALLYQKENDVPEQYFNDYIACMDEERKKRLDNYKIVSGVLILGNVILLACLCIPLLFSVFGNDLLISQFYYIVMMMIACSLIYLKYLPWRWEKKIADLEIYKDHIRHDSRIWHICKGDKKAILYYPLQALQDTSKVHVERQKHRKMITYIFGILCGISLIFSVYLMSFPVLVCGVCLAAMSYTYIDYYINVRLYTDDYDKIDKRASDVPGDSALFRGLAKIYESEYRNNGNEFEVINQKRYFCHTKECMLYIFSACRDRRKDNFQIKTAGMAALSFIVFLIACVYSFEPRILLYFHLQDRWFYSVVSVLILFVSVMNLSDIRRGYNFSRMQEELAYYSQWNTAKAQDLKRKMDDFVQRGIITELDVARGVFKYDCEVFQNGKKITSLPACDRMKYLHRTITNISRLNTYLVLSAGAAVSIISWHCQIKWGLLIIPVAVVLYCINRYLLLDKINGKKIVKYIEQLDKAG